MAMREGTVCVNVSSVGVGLGGGGDSGGTRKGQKRLSVRVGVCAHMCSLKRGSMFLTSRSDDVSLTIELSLDQLGETHETMKGECVIANGDYPQSVAMIMQGLGELAAYYVEVPKFPQLDVVV